MMDDRVAQLLLAGMAGAQDPHWDPFYQPRSLAERFEMASGARDVPGLANGRR